MKIIALSILFLCTLFQSVHAQDRILTRDSLPVFIIQDGRLVSIVDDFIADTKHIGTGPYRSQYVYSDTQNIDDNSPDAFYIYIEIGDDTMSLTMSLREQNASSDSLIIYKNPNYRQAFILHKDILFRANVTSSFPDGFNNDLLTDLTKQLPTKQAVYFKDPPSDYYDLSRRGGHPLFDTSLSVSYDYDGTKWY